MALALLDDFDGLDGTRQCKGCGASFWLARLTRKQYIRKGYQLPRHCRDCRRQRRREQQENRPSWMDA